jgi:dienelactone hydrolase
MRRDIEFNAEGTILRGWLYLPEHPAHHVPGVVMAHGFTAVKEMYLDRYAEVFAAAGLGVLVFDHRNFGSSDGALRGEIDPWAQVRDYRHAISFARTLPEIDPRRIGIWGTSYSGGHTLVVGALDRRVRCVVSQVPAISGYQATLRRVPAPQVPALLTAFEADREQRFRGAPPTMRPVLPREPGGPAVFSGEDAIAFFRTAAERAPNWGEEITLRSVEMAREYEPAVYISRISPTPLLVIAATDDNLTGTDLTLEAYERALQPKQLLLISGGHFVPYVQEFPASSGAARDWFLNHL